MQFGLAGLPTDPRIAGGLPTQLITGYSDLGRQATNPQWQYPTVCNPKVNYTWLTGAQSFKAGYEFQHINIEVQDVNPLYGRDTYTGQFTRPAGAAANNLYNLADFMLGLRSQYALSSVLVAQPAAATCTSPTCRTTGASTSKLTLNLGLRYEYATPYVGSGQRPVELRSGDADDDRRRRTARSPIARWSIPDRNNFGPRLGFAYTLDARHRRPRRLRHQLRALQPRRRRRPAADQRPAGGQRGRQPDRPDGADVSCRRSRAIRPG